jgi:Domain of unknown function (DUF4209)
MPIPLTVAEIDAVAGKAGGKADYYLSAAFWKEARSEGLPAEKADAFRLVGHVLGLPLNPSNSPHPFGNPQNNRSFENIAPERAADLGHLAIDVQLAQIRARLADVAWMKTRKTPDFARLAVAAYIESARASEDPRDWTECAKRVERAARLSRSLGANDESFASVSSYLLEIVRRYRGSDPLFLTGKIVELLLEFEIGEPDEYVEYLSNAIAAARDAGEFHRCRYYLDVLARVHDRRKDAHAKNETLRELAKTFELEAERHAQQDKNLVAAHFFNQAIQAHRRVPGSAAYVDALRPKLQVSERASISELKRISVPLEIDEQAANARMHVSGLQTRQAILRLAHIVPIESFESMKEIVLKNASIAPLSHITGGTALDSEGRTIGIKPGLSMEEESHDEALFSHIVEQMRFHRSINVQAVIVPAFEQVINEHAIELKEMENLASYSPFVPPGREGIFSEGLYAGFAQDFRSALHLLVPQIENSFRYLMQENEIITTKLDNSGVQRQIDLNELVVDQRLAAIISPNILFEVRCLMTDNRGPNLRNQIAHGMLDDSAFLSVEAIYAWWLILLICLFGPTVKVSTPEAQSE